jgi:hypothetical protein
MGVSRPNAWRLDAWHLHPRRGVSRIGAEGNSRWLDARFIPAIGEAALGRPSVSSSSVSSSSVSNASIAKAPLLQPPLLHTMCGVRRGDRTSPDRLWRNVSR